MNVLVVIPCYNEEGSIQSTIERLKDKTPHLDFVVINDGSIDGTGEICTKNRYPVISLPFNLGLASAVQTGMRYAYLNKYEAAVQFDGDGQHLSEYLPEMAKIMQEHSADIVVGSRYTQKNTRSLRGFGGGLIRFAIRITTGKTLSDPTSGLRMFNRKMIEDFATKMNYGPEPDTLAYLINRGATVIEVPVTMQERKSGTSYLNTLNAMKYMLRMFVSILIIQRFRAMEGKI